MKSNDRRDLDLVFALMMLGEPLMKAIYTVLDGMMKALEADVLCHDGCANCCYQMVGVHNIEWRYIESWLLALPRKQRRDITGHSRSGVEWTRKQPADASSQTLGRLWGNRPCPYLRDDRCLIYEARPSKCRTAFSTKPCIRDGNVQFNRRLQGALDAMYGDVDERFPRVAVRDYDEALVKMMMESELYGRG